MRARCSSARSGHTLVELVVVVTLLSIGGTLAVRGTIPFYGALDAMKSRADSAQELMLAREFLRADLSAAVSAVATKSGSLLIVRENAAARRSGLQAGEIDPGVSYLLQGDKLLRVDALLGESIVVADGMAGFTVTQVSASETRIQVQDGRGQDRHSITLVWAQA
jgi:type II secretory pathway component PulJ